MTAYYNEIDHMFCAYLITNRISGKQYVGITGHGIRRRWQNHVADSKSGRRKFVALGRAIRKYGASAFDVEWIASARSWNDLLELEVILIKQWGTKGPTGYNMTDGGEGMFNLSPEIKESIRSKNIGRKHTEEAKRRIGLAGIGRVASDKKRKLLSQARRGKPLSDEHRKKLSLAKLGKILPPRSAEHSARISEGLRRAWLRRRQAS